METEQKKQNQAERTKKIKEKVETKPKTDGPEATKPTEENVQTPQEKPEEKDKKQKIKTKLKTEAVVNAKDIPISTKHSAAICKFIKNKKIDNAINELELVLRLKKQFQ